MARKVDYFAMKIPNRAGEAARLLKAMGKGFDTGTAYAKLKMLHEGTGVPIGTLFLIGFPGETEDWKHRIAPARCRC